MTTATAPQRPLVSVILVNYRGSEDVIECVSHLREVDWPADRLEIVVVDNDSQDGSEERLRAELSGVTLVQSGANLGFAGGCNFGVAKSTGEYVAFLNSDAKPDAQWVAAAIADNIMRLTLPYGPLVLFAALFLLNGPHWIDDPFGPRQLVSWTLITVSAALALAGAHALRTYGQAGPQRNEPELYAFERTSRLVTRGIYRYLRHPLYSSLLFLAWGVFLKRPGAAGLALAAAATLFLGLTARRDEAECRSYFGAAYDAYAARTPGFLPFGP